MNSKNSEKYLFQGKVPKYKLRIGVPVYEIVPKLKIIFGRPQVQKTTKREKNAFWPPTSLK